MWNIKENFCTVQIKKEYSSLWDNKTSTRHWPDITTKKVHENGGCKSTCTGRKVHVHVKVYELVTGILQEN